MRDVDRETLRELRKDAGRSIEYVAEAVGMSMTDVRRVEKLEKYLPLPAKLRLWAKAIELSEPETRRLIESGGLYDQEYVDGVFDRYEKVIASILEREGQLRATLAAMTGSGDPEKLMSPGPSKWT